MRITNARMAASDPLVQFFALVFALSAPFWLVGYIAQRTDIGLPYQLPVSALQAVCPVLAASICVVRREGRGAVAKLCRQVLHRGRGGTGAWYLPAVLLMPLVMLLSYWVQVVAGKPSPTTPYRAPDRARALPRVSRSRSVRGTRVDGIRNAADTAARLAH